MIRMLIKGVVLLVVGMALQAMGGDWKEMSVTGCFDPKGGHVQGMCTDGQFLYLTQMTGIYKIDRSGACVKKIAAVSHTGDLCYHDGRIYTSVAVYGGPDKGKGKIQVFDTELNLIKEKTYPRGLDGIVWLDGILYVGRGSHLETVPHKEGEKAQSKTPHFQNEVLRVDPVTLEVKDLTVIEHGFKTRYGAQNIATDGKDLYFCFYGTPDLVVYGKDLKPLRRYTANVGNGFEFVGVENGVPKFIKCKTTNWKGKDRDAKKGIVANISFATLKEFKK